MPSVKVFYSCRRCPAYCCSYPHIKVNKRDLERLARHFGMSVEAARRKLTKRGERPGERILRHKADDTYATICRFCDSDSRACTVYRVRPKICRDFPGGVRCGYYDFLSFERRLQKDPDYVATTDNRTPVNRR